MKDYTITMRKCPTNYTSNIFKSCDKETAIKAVELFERSECVYNVLSKDGDYDERHSKWNLFLYKNFGINSSNGVIIMNVSDADDNIVYKEGRHGKGVHTLIEHLL